MDDTHIVYSQEDEIKGINVQLDLEGTNSNGHGGKEEYINLAETLRKLQTYVQSHKDNNDRLMKAKEQQEDFNMKLMKTLDRIEKKLDKESGSSKSGSQGTPKGRGISRSDGRHHHHSQRHSNRRAHSSSSPSPIREHRRFRVDELKGEMNNIKPPTFDGEQKKDEDAKTWFLGMRKYFQLHNYSSHAEGRIVIYSLKIKASMWWDQLVQVQHIREKNVTWKEIKKHLRRNV
jgi:hypothetical protein